MDFSKQCAKKTTHNNHDLTLIGGHGDMIAYYEDELKKIWIYSLCTRKMVASPHKKQDIGHFLQGHLL